MGSELESQCSIGTDRGFLLSDRMSALRGIMGRHRRDYVLRAEGLVWGDLSDGSVASPQWSRAEITMCAKALGRISCIPEKQQLKAGRSSRVRDEEQRNTGARVGRVG